MKLYLLGGRQKHRLLKEVDDDHRFESAVIIHLDVDTSEAKVALEYKTPASVSADRNSSSRFASGLLFDHKVYVCTLTEVLVYSIPDFKLMSYISLPCFNALHHVCLSTRDTLLVANTGLDMVQEMTLGGKVLRQWNVVGGNTWERFSPEVDYRLIASTRPHRAHPNFVFCLGDEIWVTRFLQRDAVCLTNPRRRIDIGVEKPHDGLPHEGRLYFTTVDGHLVIIDSNTLQKLEVINLSRIASSLGGLVRGWCRGVLPIGDRWVWIGFTRIRKTAMRENLSWIKHGLREVDAPTHIALYDIVDRKCLKTIDVEQFDLNILFSILPAPEL